MLKFKERKDLNKTKSTELKKALETETGWQPIKFIWKDDRAQKFIDFIVDETNGLLQKFRVVTMNWPTKSIVKVLDNGRILKPSWGYKRRGGTVGADPSKFWTEKIELVSKKAETVITLDDDELQDNLEWEAWENHVMQIASKKIANEIVETAIYGRKIENPNWENGILNLFNGIKYLTLKNWNVIDLSEEANRYVTRWIIIKWKKVIKSKYRSELNLFLDSDIKTDIDELYNDPNGNRWDGEIIKNSVSWMNINEVPLMNAEQPVATSTATTVSTATTAWVLSITIASVTGITAGNEITVNIGTENEITYKVTAVDTSNKVLTLESPLLYALNVWDTVTVVNTDGADVILTNPKNVVVWIQKEVAIELERLAPDWWNIRYTLRMDIVIENPEASAIITGLKSKN